MTSPDTLRWAADALRHEALELVPALEQFLNAIGPEVWSCPAADVMRADLERDRTSLGDVAVELEGLASQLDAHAAQLEAQQRIDALHAAEARERARYAIS